MGDMAGVGDIQRTILGIGDDVRVIEEAKRVRCLVGDFGRSRPCEAAPRESSLPDGMHVIGVSVRIPRSPTVLHVQSGVEIALAVDGEFSEIDVVVVQRSRDDPAVGERCASIARISVCRDRSRQLTLIIEGRIQPDGDDVVSPGRDGNLGLGVSVLPSRGIVRANIGRRDRPEPAAFAASPR